MIAIHHHIDNPNYLHTSTLLQRFLGFLPGHLLKQLVLNLQQAYKVLILEYPTFIFLPDFRKSFSLKGFIEDFSQGYNKLVCKGLQNFQQWVVRARCFNNINFLHFLLHVIDSNSYQIFRAMKF